VPTPPTSNRSPKNEIKWIVIPFFKFNVGYILKQATIAERANAFRRQCELAETMKLKEINLYAPVPHFYYLTNLVCTT
jgi:hypothetical protein